MLFLTFLFVLAKYTTTKKDDGLCPTTFNKLGERRQPNPRTSSLSWGRAIAGHRRQNSRLRLFFAGGATPPAGESVR